MPYRPTTPRIAKPGTLTARCVADAPRGCPARPRAWALLLAVLALPACQDGPGSAEAGVARDSAGVAITENPGDVWSGPEAWRLSTSPMLRIGAVDGEAPYLFGNIEGLVALSDGRVVVADRDRTLRWYGPGGEFLFQRGGEGGGPGEFGRISGLTVAAGDTVVVRDGTAGRMTTLGPDGSLVGTAPTLGVTQSRGPGYRLSDGSLVVVDHGYTRRPRDRESLEPGLMRRPARVLRLSEDGARADTLGAFPGSEQLVRQREGRLVVEPPVFSRSLSFTAGDDRIYLGPQDPFEINVYSPEGEWLRSIRAPDVDIELGPDRIEAFRSWMLSRLEGRPPEQKAAMMRPVDAMLEAGLPDRVPAYSTLLLDPGGHLWVGEYRFELNRHPPDRWVIFDREGRLVSLVRTPPGFELMAVAEDRVYGRATDELNVQYVVGYAIER